ncbi:fructosamine kinase family protein [Luteimonas sp. Y-2-2-4F]|nr:fructosamine kinase family protein [Luteimonas sp. Y-2-2-4F]MCD9033428.1 fructosamine kinase family protein [Luteimonas sp. Y-2-2-4F]
MPVPHAPGSEAVEALAARLPGDGVHRCTFEGRPAVAKRRDGAPPGWFEAEAHGLRTLAAVPGGLRVARVLACRPGLLLLEDLGRGRPGPGDWARAGEALARQHAVHAPRFGFDRDGWCGDGAQDNAPDDDGWRFFARRRLWPQARRAAEAGRLAAADLGRVERLCARLPDRVPPQPASLLHGDLWTGNLHPCAGGALALIDAAAVHYGWAEAELAMLTLFGSPPPAFFDAYAAAGAVAADWRERAPVYNLYHLLNHLNLFGAGYLGAVREALREAGG